MLCGGANEISPRQLDVLRSCRPFPSVAVR